MIEVAQDNNGQAIAPTPEAAVVADVARTQEVVHVYGNVEVHTQTEPRVVTPVYGADYADSAVSTLEPESHDPMTDSTETKPDEAAPLSDAHAATGAMAAAYFATPGTEAAVEQVFGADRDVAGDETFALAPGDEHTQVPADQATDDATQDALGLPRLDRVVEPEAAAAPIVNAAPRNVSVKASGPAHGGLGVDWKNVPQVPVDAAPEGAAEEPIVTPSGVDLTRLTHFNEERSARPPKSPKKPRRPEGERQAPRAAAPQKPALLRSEKSQNYLRDAIAPKKEDNDGEQHINTSAMAVTKLGKMLSMNANVPFNHPDLGPFKSVGGLWYFVGMNEPRDDAFRTLFGGACRQRGQKVEMREVRGFRTIIADATWIKVNSDEQLVKAMVENDLPYLCYFTVGDMNMRQSPPMADWYMPVLEEIGRTLKAIHIDKNVDAVPDFEFLERRYQAPQRQPQGRPQGRGDNRNDNRDNRNQGQRQGQDRRVR